MKGSKNMSNFELTVITNRPRFNNPRLEHATQLLMQCDSEVRTRQYDIASILGSIESEKLYVDDNEFVKKDKLLVQIDDRDYKVRYEQAKAASSKRVADIIRITIGFAISAFATCLFICETDCVYFIMSGLS